MKKIDSVVLAVIEKFISRSDAGIRKYGITLERTDLTHEEWITHLQEELMDAALYIERIKMSMKQKQVTATSESWLNADKKVVDGFLYIKISDLDILPF